MTLSWMCAMKHCRKVCGDIVTSMVLIESILRSFWLILGYLQNSYSMVKFYLVSFKCYFLQGKTIFLIFVICSFVCCNHHAFIVIILLNFFTKGKVFPLQLSFSSLFALVRVLRISITCYLCYDVYIFLSYFPFLFLSRI